MKESVLVILLLLFSFTLFSREPNDGIGKNTMTVGLLKGGGSLIGADFEFLLSDQVGFQLGAGFIGYGFGLNYHLKPSIRSSFISIQYWHQGVGDSFAQSLIGPGFVFRGEKWFAAQLGIGFALSEGPAFPSGRVQPPIMLTYSIGAYIPL